MDVALRGVGATTPTSRRLRSAYYITTDRLIFIVFKKLTPKFLFINACIPRVYNQYERIKAFQLLALEFVEWQSGRILKVVFAGASPAPHLVNS